MTHAVGLFDSQAEPSIPTLVDWLLNHDAFISDGIEIKPSPSGGFGVFAGRDMDPDELIWSLPKTSLLSTRTTSLRLPPELQVDRPDPEGPMDSVRTNRTVPTLALVLLHELRLGGQSEFWGYLQSLPRTVEGLPIFWPEDGDARRWLKGTEADRELVRKGTAHMGLADLKRFYEGTNHLLPPTPTHASPSPVEAYLHAYRLITTRAFLIDLYHTLALVPFADLLNHSSRNHTSLASDDFVCHICGSLASCTHDSDHRRLRHLDVRQRSKVEQEPDTVDMRVERAVLSGEEVMNTYGEGIGDSRLLVEWGFIEGEFAGHGLQWEIREVFGHGAAEEEGVWRSVMARGAVSLDLFPDYDMGDPDLDDEDGGGLVAPPDPKDPTMLNLDQDGRISLSLWVAVCLRHLPPMKPARLDATLVEAYHQLESVADDSSRKSTSAHITAAIQNVVDILTARLNTLHRPEADVEELLDMRDALPEEKRDLRMAMTITIDERTLLQSALGEWREILAKSRAATS